jgi:rubrerythrin
MRHPELHAVEVEGMTRSAFILRGALAAGAAYGLSAVGPFVAGAFGQTPQGDIAVLKFALALETLESTFYTAAQKSAKLSGEMKKLATEFGKQEATHASTLKQAIEQLGGGAGPALQVKVNVKDEQSFLKLGVVLEDLGVGAYNGSIPTLKTPDLIAATASIVQTEGRHAGALRFRANQAPAPAAFDKGLTPKQVQAALKKL